MKNNYKLKHIVIIYANEDWDNPHGIFKRIKNKLLTMQSKDGTINTRSYNQTKRRNRK